MLGKAFKKLFSSQADREFKKSQDQIAEINRYADSQQSLSDIDLRERTQEFRGLIAECSGAQTAKLNEVEERLRDDLEPAERERLNDQHHALQQEVHRLEEEALTEIMPQAFGLVKEACRRLVGRSWEGVAGPEEWFMVPYDVQLFGAIILHQGQIAEMATGEGKTLVATMPLYLNALPSHGVHLITHNNYLAKRDAMWMGGV
ncbi:uncharacterized protein METZ01_LOCUS344615, partial [marine metagenome]